MKKKDNCQKGQSCGTTCIARNYACEQGSISKEVAKKVKSLGKKEKFNFTEKLDEGSFGKVLIDREKKVVQKIPKVKNGIGEEELILGFKMGERGYSPRVYPEYSDKNKMTMDLALGNNFEELNQENSDKVFSGLRYMQRNLGYSHNDLHSGNVIGGKIIDYGKATKISENGKSGLADWADLVKYTEYPLDPDIQEVFNLAMDYDSDPENKERLSLYRKWLNK